jgi:hypothetical protein
MEEFVSTRGEDEAEQALRGLDIALAKTIDDLQVARARLADIDQQREGGRSWREIAECQPRPLAVEVISQALDRLAMAGSAFRRAQADALHREGMSMERVAGLFGVTRQRVSALLRERSNP